MFTRSTLVRLGLSTTVAVLALGGVALADPPDSLISPPNHRHFLVTPDGGLVPIGPDICADPQMQTAFNQFHYNVHHPQFGAPGLHDSQPGSIIGVFGCG